MLLPLLLLLLKFLVLWLRDFGVAEAEFLVSLGMTRIAMR